MLKPGDKLFEYEIIRQLGKGGFAVVYKAQDRMLDRPVAIKQLSLDKVQSETAVKRFMQEARIIGALEHPNVVTIYALRIAQKRIYSIMEYLPGGNLGDLVDAEGEIELDRTVKLISGICEGLSKLHEQHIIHRDIKAENILLTADGRPKIIDFGIAHVPEKAGGLKLTKIGFQPSTMLYSSPEQFRGETVDIRSDVYQVGELLYYLLMGKHYVDIDKLDAEAHEIKQNLAHDLKLYMLVERAICKEPIQELALIRERYGAIAEVIEKAMAKNKEDRYNTIMELVADLWAHHMTSPAHFPTPSPEVTPA